jgi:hypothetical protein
MTDKLNQISEVRVGLWTSVMSPAVGALAWSAMVPDLGIIEDTESKLAVDPSYMALVDEAAVLLSTSQPADQMLMRVVHGDPDAERTVAHYASTVRAALGPGSMRAGIEVGAELAQKAKAVTGRPTSFAVGVTGDYGAVMWVSLAETIQELQAANEALDADEEFSKLVDREGSKVFLPGATTTIARKLA